MATLTVWKYDTEGGADAALSKLIELQKQELITVIDAAVVSWQVGKKKPNTEQMHPLVGNGALGGAFWGLLLGIIFFVPVLGLIAGAAAGALSGALSDVGIDDGFIEQTRAAVTPGTSALFLMSQDEVADRVSSEMSGNVAELISSNLTSEQEAKIREAFTD